MMNPQSKSMVVGALIKVINSAPTLSPRINYIQPSTYQRSDISMQEFNTWVDYTNQTLDISYNHISLDIIITTKINISRISSQQGIAFLQRIEQIKQELFHLAQTINLLS